MTEPKKKRGRPPKVVPEVSPGVKEPAGREVYCVMSSLKTSKGMMAHGDRLKLPHHEAERLIGEGKVT